ncbi:MAG: ribonuclease M5 [Erysipelotrichaceae bacterium]|nr:ribonuclease M5 [Erysipelotrichaceae bacterium]
MKRIDEVIIVEGKNDAHRIHQVIDADIICTYGLSMPQEILDSIVEIAQHRKIIIFTDPDSPGNRIRHKIAELVPDASHVYLQTKQARGNHKVGVEHASLNDILEAFEHVSEGKCQKESLSWKEYIELGLNGGTKSKQKRQQVAERMHIGEANAKTFYHRLNMIQATKEMIERVLIDE